MKSNTTESLESPGAGLPGYERWVANVMVHAQPKFRSPASFSDLFSDELQMILTLVEGVSVDSAARPVLIDRIRGIEDSSRHWSVYMTLDHLRIVNLGMVGVIKGLLSDRDSAVTPIAIAEVKPDTDSGPEVVATFTQAARIYQRNLRDCPR